MLETGVGFRSQGGGLSLPGHTLTFITAKLAAGVVQTRDGRRARP